MLLLTLSGILSKFIIYVGLAMVLGGLFIDRLLRHEANILFSHRHYIGYGCIMGLVATGVDFFIQAGNFAEEGLSGMWNPLFVKMLWLSSIGDSVMVRLAGFICVATSYYILTSRTRFNRKWRQISSQSMLMLGLLLLLYSFTLTGHLAEQPAWLRLMLAAHLFVVLGWIGALYPLRNSAVILPIHSLQRLIQRFENIILLLVATALIAGLVMAQALLGNLSALLTSPYGQLLIAKLVLVSIMLVFALRHKYQIVPGLQQPGKVYQLRQSILGELYIGLCILLLTVTLTLLFSPS